MSTYENTRSTFPVTLTRHPAGTAFVDGVQALFRAWRKRARERHELAQMGTRGYADIGVNHSTAQLEIGRRAVAEAEMMLAEEDALEAEILGAAPQIEVPAVMLGRDLRRDVGAAPPRHAEQLENPRLDHGVAILAWRVILPGDGGRR